MHAYTLIVARVEGQAVRSIVLSTLAASVTSIASLALLVWLKIGLPGVFISYAAGYGVVGLLGLYLMRKSQRLFFSVTRFKHMLRFGVPVMVGVVAAWISGSVSRFVLPQSASLSDVGYYAVSLKIAGIAGQIGQSINFAWMPTAYAALKQEGAKQQFSSTFVLLMAGTVLMIIPISLFGYEIVLIMSTPEYLPAAVNDN